jgi:hypothetical protein
MTDEEFILRNLKPTSWWSEFVNWLTRNGNAPPQNLFALTDDDLP